MVIGIGVLLDDCPCVDITSRNVSINCFFRYAAIQLMEYKRKCCGIGIKEKCGLVYREVVIAKLLDLGDYLWHTKRKVQMLRDPRLVQLWLIQLTQNNTLWFTLFIMVDEKTTQLRTLTEFLLTKKKKKGDDSLPVFCTIKSVTLFAPIVLSVCALLFGLFMLTSGDTFRRFITSSSDCDATSTLSHVLNDVCGSGFALLLQLAYEDAEYQCDRQSTIGATSIRPLVKFNLADPVSTIEFCF